MNTKNPFNSDFGSPGHVVLAVCHVTPEWLERIGTILRDLYRVLPETRVTLLDLVSLTYPSYVTPFWRTWITKVCTPLVLDFVSVSSLKMQSLDCAIPDELLEKGRHAALSVFMSTFRDDSEPESILARSFYSRSLRSYEKSYLFCRTFFQGLDASLCDNTLLIVPNGRLPAERAVLDAFESTDTIGPKCIRYYERGSSAEDFFFQDYAPLDRWAIRDHFFSACDALEDSQLDLGRRWLELRQEPRSPNNPFSQRFQPSSTATRGKYAATLFTSSTDEFSGMGPEWRTGWPAQFEAFSKLISRLKEVCSEPISIRLHPNLLNKRAPSFRREIKSYLSLRDKDVDVFLPGDTISSYELIRNSRRVIIWGSTLGMEALYLSRPVWATGIPYGLDVLPILKIQSQEDLVEEPFEVNGIQTEEVAAKFAAYLILRNRPIDPSAAFPSRLNLLVKMIGLTTSGFIVTLNYLTLKLAKVRNLFASRLLAFMHSRIGSG